MWELIYRAIRAVVLIALVGSMAVLLQVAVGGPLWVWLMLMAALALGGAIAWRRFGGLLWQPRLQPDMAVESGALLTADSSDENMQAVTLAPTAPDILGKWSELSRGFFNRLESEPSAINASNTLWGMSLTQSLFFAALGITCLVALGLRLFKLDSLQAEVYGDINILHEYLFAIRDGAWPTNFILSSGPLYHYLIYPLVAVLGHSYASIKVASVVTSLFTLLFTYLLCRRLLNDWFAVIALFVAGVSSWLLVFSRLGNSQVVLPLLTVLSLWLLVRFRQEGRSRDLIVCGIVATLGLYVYPQSFPLPVTMLLVLLLFKFTSKSIRWLDVFNFCVVVALVAVPFPFIVAESTLSVNTYILPKLTDSASPTNTLFTNIANTLMAYHIQGDGTFRSNPARLPHLDVVSGIFMVIGCVYWLRRDRVLWLALLIPFILLQVPSVMVLTTPVETPSASRTLGVAPIVYIWVAGGVWWLLQLVRKRAGLAAACGVGLIGLLAIFGLNANRYFDSYINGLPYQNTSIARHIQTFADTLSPNTKVYLAGCCWESGMPEPKSIQFEMKRPDNLQYVDPQGLTCDALRSYEPGSVFVWAYSAPTPSIFLQTQACMNLLPAQTFYGDKDLPMFNAAALQTGAGALTSPLVPPPDSRDGSTTTAANELPGQVVTLDGSEVEIHHSVLDIGELQDALDKNAGTLMRGAADNPFILDMTFTQPRNMSGMTLTLGSMADVIFKATFTLADGRVSETTLESTTLPPDPRVELRLTEGAQNVIAVHIEILDRRLPPSEGFHTHVREIQILP